MIKKIIWKNTKRILLGLLVFIIIYGVIYYKEIKSFPSIISAFYSKEYCSCFFVSEGTEEFCHDYARQYVPISEFKLNRDEKTVTVKGLGRSATAKFFGDREGCRLIQ